jgi:hypothetical protein
MQNMIHGILFIVLGLGFCYPFSYLMLARMMGNKPKRTPNSSGQRAFVAVIEIATLFFFIMGGFMLFWGGAGLFGYLDYSSLK